MKTLLDNPPAMISPAEAEIITKDLNEDKEEDWVYIPENHHDSKFAKIRVYDEEGFFIGHL